MEVAEDCIALLHLQRRVAELASRFTHMVREVERTAPALPHIGAVAVAVAQDQLVQMQSQPEVTAVADVHQLSLVLTPRMPGVAVAVAVLLSVQTVQML